LEHGGRGGTGRTVVGPDGSPVADGDEIHVTGQTRRIIDQATGFVQTLSNFFLETTLDFANFPEFMHFYCHF
jgi:hypothetical protein